jgi:hypothetical protein
VPYSLLLLAVQPYCQQAAAASSIPGTTAAACMNPVLSQLPCCVPAVPTLVCSVLPGATVRITGCVDPLDGQGGISTITDGNGVASFITDSQENT